MTTPASTCPRCASNLVESGAFFVCAAFIAWQMSRESYGDIDTRKPAPCEYREVRRVFDVPAQNVARLTGKIEHLSRRARRIGTTSPTIAIGAQTQRQVKREHDLPLWVTFVSVTIVGESPRIAGWGFAATIDHDGDENIIRCAGVVDGMPIEYRGARPTCDHCKVARRRSETFVLHHDDGRWCRVGRSCLKDFLGHDDPASLAAQAEYLAEAIAEAGACEDLDGGGGGRIGDPAIEDFLAFVALAIREGGWVSRKASEATGQMSTLVCAQEFMWSKKPGLPKPNDDDRATAVAALEWARAIGDDASDFDMNLRAASKRVAVSQKNAGITAYLVAGYLRIKTERANADAAPSSYMGTCDGAKCTAGCAHGSTPTKYGAKGTKRNPAPAALVLTVERVTPMPPSQYGTAYLHVMRDDAGNVFKWFASGGNLDMGERYTVTGTVKAHEEYRGVRQTTLTRCNAVKVGTVAPAKPGASVVQGQWRQATPDMIARGADAFVYVERTRRDECYTIAYDRDGRPLVQMPRDKASIECWWPNIVDSVPAVVAQYAAAHPACTMHNVPMTAAEVDEINAATYPCAGYA